MIRTLVVATVALLGLLGAPPASRPAEAALIERQDIPGLFRVYDELHFSGGSTTGETGFYDFYFRVGARDFRTLSVATLFGSDELLLSNGVRAVAKLYTQCCVGRDRRLEQPFDHNYIDEGLNTVGVGAQISLSSSNNPYRLRIKI